MGKDLLVNKKLLDMCKVLDYSIRVRDDIPSDKLADNYVVNFECEGREIELFYGQEKGSIKPSLYDAVIIFMDYGNNGGLSFNSFCSNNNFDKEDIVSRQMWDIAREVKHRMQYLLGDHLDDFLGEVFEKTY